MGHYGIFLFVAVTATVIFRNNSSAAPAEGGEELFLTPLIKSGEIDKAREASRGNMQLSKIKSEKDVKSYSGYLTIDEAKNSNLFFWFFPSQEAPEKAPVILWINDLPGHTCLKGVFLETGPFYVDENIELKARNSTWTRTHSMLYIDAPVGSGFSFTDSEDGYAKSSDDDAVQLYEALQQFFTIFKDFQPNDFYLAGENYAGTTMPYIAKKIHAENEKNSQVKINLKGIIMGSPYLHSLQLHKANYLHSLGLISAAQKKEMTEAVDKVLDLVKENKLEEAVELSISIFVGPNSMGARMTGFQQTYNALTSQDPPSIGNFLKFIDSKEVHNYLHAGLHKFVAANNFVLKKFKQDGFGSHIEPVAELLDLGYRILIYHGQFDIFFSHDKMTEVISKLKWKLAQEFASAPRKIWRLEDDVAGYAQSIGNFAYVLVRNAGNYAIQDQPEWTTDLVERFLSGKEF